jgi:pimeloyl-ACP methyl ester carboxylesterase
METRVGNSQYILKRISAIAAASCLVVLQSFSQNKPTQSGYAPVNGLKMYYEVYEPASEAASKAKPLVLLHGSFMNIDMTFGQLIPGLSKTRKIIAVEFQGHGRTADIDRPFSGENFADDIAAVLKFLKIDSADILGYSLGGEVAAQLAIRQPQMVRKLVIVSSAFKFDGWSPETRAVFPMITPEIFAKTPIKTEYDRLAPDTAHWAQFIRKMVQFVSTPYDFMDKARSLKKPMLLIFGDSDGILPEHAAEMFRSAGGVRNGDLAGLPNSQLAIFPGTSHTAVIMRTGWLLSMIPPFLDAPVH